MAFSEETGDRIAWTKIEQMQSNKYKVLAFYVSPNELLTTSFHEKQIPSCHKLVIYRTPQFYIELGVHAPL